MANIGSIANGEAGNLVRNKLNLAITEANEVDSKLDAAAYTAADVKAKYEGNANTNAFTDAEQSKLTGIEAGAQANVNADWDAISGDAQILNRPALGTAVLADADDFATAAQGARADTALQPGDAVTSADVASIAVVTEYPATEDPDVLYIKVTA